MSYSFDERRRYNDLMGTYMILSYDSYSIVIHNSQFMNQDHIEFPHSHDFHELYYVLNGRMVVICDGKELELEKNDTLYLAPNVDHNMKTDTFYGNERFLITFEIIKNKCDDSKMTALEYQIDEMITILKNSGKFSVSKDTNNVIALIDDLCGEFLNRQHFYYLKLQGLISLILMSMIQNIINGKDNGLNDYLEYENRALLMTKYIHNNIGEKITLEKMAVIFHTTPRHVNRIFKKYFNTSFNKTLLEIRLGYAKRYLVEYDCSIEKIAELVGFDSVRTLYKLFKEKEFMSMNEYRNKYLGKLNFSADKFNFDNHISAVKAKKFKNSVPEKVLF
ncbi:AraC family transcriptional regulator [Acetobacterium woodii]|uniref:Transcriptional regulator AraC family n=1 Tax=Acetobacterium woodii (strain ATCC 29683 / DSM 1030 / JCM 2381 / KCTC 1655 / WB1) TaxID=931626 RepID=H6LFZ1_ACEWD|nr:AraC family transcriptional regulator [Acetobacterium woodii]AFA48279.1 transcriptional regulator AraC family [Acetobacterium woodii DSM 1030]